VGRVETSSVCAGQEGFCEQENEYVQNMMMSHHEGDCMNSLPRCVFSRGGQAVVLTKDHKPDQPQEEKRIVTAGHFVGPSRRGGIPRVGGNLAMSRAMGDVKVNEAQSGEQHGYAPADPLSHWLWPHIAC
jgi:serine/threonine protein phosphatase PrpC